MCLLCIDHMANQTSEIKISLIALMRVLLDDDPDYKIEISNSYIADGHAYLGIRIIDQYKERDVAVACDDIYYDMNDMMCYTIDEKLFQTIKKSLSNAASKYIQSDLFADERYNEEKSCSGEMTKENFTEIVLPI